MRPSRFSLIPQMRTERARDAASLLLLTLAVAAFFWPLLLTEAWLPRGGGDLVSFLWPMARFAARSLRRGVVPLWNPHLYSGAPFVADNQSGVFYPVNLLTYALVGPPSYGVMEALVALHVWIAAVGAFVLLRDLRVRRSAAVLGALAFALSDLFVTHLGNLNLNATAAWLPLLLWAARRALVRRSAGWAAGAGAVLAVAALAGHAQLVLFLSLALALYALYRVGVVVVAEDRGWRRRAQKVGLTLALSALIAAVGFGGAALTLLPAARMAAHTGRGHLPYAEAVRYSLPPRALIGLLAPGFYGRGPANFWGPWERVEVGYAGVVTLVLAALGIGLLVRRLASDASTAPRRREVRRRAAAFGFFALLIPVALLLALGAYAPFYRLLYRLVPTFDQIRAPARLIVLGDLGLAVMGAYGLDRLLNQGEWGSHARVWLGLALILAALLLLAVGLDQARSVPPPDRVPQATRSVVIAAALLGLTGLLIVLARWRWWTGWLFPLLLAVDLIALGSTVEIERHDPSLGFQHPEVVAFLEEDPTLFRIEDAAAAWQPSAALVHGLYDVGGVYNPLALAPYEAYRWSVGQRGSPLYNLLGVKYVLADKGEPPGDERLVPVYEGEAIDVYLNTAALPRALFVTQTRVVADHEAAWEAIHAPGFDPARTVVLEEIEGTPGGPAAPANGDAAAHIAFARYGLNEVELRVESDTEGWLVLSDVYYPGWRATVDDVRTPVRRADYVFRAVRVPAGQHVVRMVFDPWPWRLGLVVTLITWVALASQTFEVSIDALRHALRWFRKQFSGP